MRKRKKGNRKGPGQAGALPFLAGSDDISAQLRPWYEAGSHWFLLRPAFLLDALVIFGQMGPRLGRDDFLAMVPIPGTLASLIVLAFRKDRMKAKEVLEAMGHGPDRVSRLEEEMVAGRDILCLTDEPELATAALKLMHPILEG